MCYDHPILSVAYPPRFDPWGRTRRALLLCVNLGFLIIITSVIMIFLAPTLATAQQDLSNAGLQSILLALYPQIGAVAASFVYTWVFDLFATRVINYFIECSSRNSCAYLGMMTFGLLPVFYAAGIFVSYPSLVLYVLSSWVASIPLSFISSLASGALLLRVWNTAEKVKEMNATFREFDLHKRDVDYAPLSSFAHDKHAHAPSRGPVI